VWTFDHADVEVDDAPKPRAWAQWTEQENEKVWLTVRDWTDEVQEQLVQLAAEVLGA
jgi:hypothetical protein